MSSLSHKQTLMKISVKHLVIPTDSDFLDQYKFISPRSDDILTFPSVDLRLTLGTQKYSARFYH